MLLGFSGLLIVVLDVLVFVITLVVVSVGIFSLARVATSDHRTRAY